MNTHTLSRSFVAFLFLALPLVVSCGRYPNVPVIRDVTVSGQASSETENIGQIFQKKASTFLSESQESQRDYQAGPEDVLQISVWDHEDLCREVIVSQEGEFTYPLIGKVRADGRTVTQIEEDVRGRLSGRFIIDPQVTVTVKEYKSKKVFVLGEVGAKGKGPGAYPLAGKTTLLEILSMAGGPTDNAGTEVMIVRPTNHTPGNPTPLEKAKNEDIITVNLAQILEGDTSQNVLLEPNDSIYVPRTQYFYVFGQVKQPGRYKLEKGTTVLKAITTAGGVTDKAAINDSKVLREREGEKISIAVVMTDPVMAEDVIMVPESFF
ncbi:polysaccharide biosynthesis/export family protein [Thermodesulfobacteriota bacterium]